MNYQTIEDTMFLAETYERVPKTLPSANKTITSARADKPQTTKTMKDNKTNQKICCGVLEILLIQWMTTEEGIKLMPHITGKDGKLYRVNHCPSCGTYIRDIQINPTT